MAPSDKFKAAIFARETDEVFILLVTIDHADLSEPIRVSSDGADTLSRGETFVSFPFEITLPNDTEDAPPEATLKIDNIDRSIVQAIRSISSPPNVLIEIVLASEPNAVESVWNDFKLQNVDYDVLVVSGNLTQEDFSAEPYPAMTMDPANFPGIH